MESRALQPSSRRREGGVVSALTSFRPHHHPKTTTALVLWLLGLYLVLLAKPPVQPTAEQVAAFERKLKEVESLDGDLAKAYQQYVDLEAELSTSKVWFWRWRAAYREHVLEQQPGVDAAWARVAKIKKRQERLFSDAKSQLGLWSEAGVGESRDLFWKSFQSGKLFAQRQSFWDALFTVLNSRERDWLSMLIQLIITTVVNFTTGLSVSVVVFLARLPGLLISYQPSFGSALLFFTAAAVGAISVVASYLGLLYAAGATAVYTTVSLVDARRRLEGPQRRRIAEAASHED